MSTRAVYTFVSKSKYGLKEVHVYKHHDGYPQGAIGFISNAKVLFLTDKEDFKDYRDDTSFRDRLVVGFFVNNIGNGHMELTTSWKDHGDLEYRYEIKDDLNIKIFQRDFSGQASYDENKFKLIYDAPLKDFQKSDLFKRIEMGVA